MRKVFILYNALSHNGKGLNDAQKLKTFYPEYEAVFTDITEKGFDFTGFINRADPEDILVLTGGDGTVNFLANAAGGSPLQHEIYFYPSGTGNDFIRDLGEKADLPVLINPYITGLPKVTVNGKTSYFINGIGFGLDGFCCEESDRLKEKGKSLSYTLIAVMGLLWKFKPVNGRITVDGVTREYEKIWMAPVMHGSYYGGGVYIAPKQKRGNRERTLTSVAIHCKKRFLTIILFIPAITGKGEKLKKHLAYTEGHHIEVEFDEPRALQIDGETILGVTRYSCDLD